MLNEEDPFGTGLRFALQVTGFELATEPPEPDTPHILAYAAEHGYDALTDEHFDLAKLGPL
ncbi:hypothetical protein [Streptomyces sp. NPDC001388]|uniref:hypothetical protein n=1 Tax=Streptomyces sp. NPDC001388 TaxID=3364568 RepID=UPI00368B87FC